MASHCHQAHRATPRSGRLGGHGATGIQPRDPRAKRGPHRGQWPGRPTGDNPFLRVLAEGMSLRWRPVSDSDLEALVRMNRRLIEDQVCRNPMTDEQLRTRLAGWLSDDAWKVEMLVQDDTTVGYTVYRFEQDEYVRERAVVHLRQYYIERDCRRRGLGRAGLAWLITERFPHGCELVLEVLASNPAGERFWSSAGFLPYALTMKRQIARS